jgi:flagellar motor component MotA
VNNFDKWIAILFGVIAILAIKSIFEHDNSKIVSKKGFKFLSDDKKMNEIDEKIKQSEHNSQNEVFI